MRFDHLICLFAASAILSLFVAGPACSQATKPSPTSCPPCRAASGAAEVRANIEVSVLSGPTAEMKLTFTPTSNPPREKDILAAVAFDLDPSKNLRNIPTGLLKDTLAAIIVVAENKHEVWFGTTIQPTQSSSSVTIQLPGIIRPHRPKGYELEFQILEGVLKKISGGLSGISQARISDVVLRLPEDWQLDSDENWEIAGRLEWKVKTKLLESPPRVIHALLTQNILALQEWMKTNITAFFSVFIGVVAAASALRRGRPKLILVFGSMIILIGVWLYSQWRGGSQEWIEYNWWLISAWFGLIVAIIIPRRLIDELLGAFKPKEPKEAEAAPE